MVLPLRLVLVLGLIFCGGDGLPTGAPPETCRDLTPVHPGGFIQDSPPPYQVLPAAGQGRVRLILGSPQGLAYEGFMLVARDIDTGKFVGEFVGLPDGTHAIECDQGMKSGITHSDTDPKQNLEFDWEAPEDYIGTIIFNSTFAQDYQTYWVGVESPRVSVLRRSIDVKTVATPAPAPRTTTPPVWNPPVKETATGVADPFYDGCGAAKNCFGHPVNCVSQKNCQAAVSVLVRGDRYLFEVYARNSVYAAVGLSDDSKMGDDSVVECVNNGNNVGLFMSWNDGTTNTRIPTPSGSVQLDSGTVTDDTISCKFWREKTSTVQGRVYDLVNTPYYLLVAAGKSLKSGGIGYHADVKAATGEAKLLSDIGSFSAASDLLIRLHGALMLAAWIGTASVGMLLARYYKQTWVSSQLCGKDQWFAWHRFFMVLTWSLTIAAFVIIFVEIGTWSSETIHASFGVATTLLCFIQPFMAVLRPHPGTPRRTIFNWAHWFVGNAAHICGIIAIFFAVQTNKAQLPEWVNWVMTAFVIFHVFSHVVLTFAGCASDRQASHRVNSFPMKDMHARSAMTHPDARRDAPQAGLRKAIFGIYFIIISVFSAALVVIVVLAPISDSWTYLTDTVSNY
ncbi:putative ferric-chelate reductase 1 homolog [Athalia rosae]|uniref:putative ferric-chelate reductase 1 homolog n=1 Tax=Athalia rosae TaxID=37344 RepID=UPI002033A2DA|nr:putative ferric-chelate reductase 1 homolog [Athalia rosae]XP_012256786.2 putative ferric-chelate reductase 1 homolog [Athalia rosae]XP_048510598.1 putative ferric-chelate reductase 1 homolog [Athalia rosae]